ncbi:SLOG family protein [Streptomyces achromogenes]|uniref:SLOG family protein n=1 Tax=Streptomyces achromogenes TaxID=67255 RepID=UPI00369763AF
MRVIVTGSRAWPDPVKVGHELTQLFMQQGSFTLIHGDCATGADAAAHQWYETTGRALGCEELRFPAAWETYGSRAGPIRNRKMVSEARADLVLAFLYGESRGTRHTINLASEAGIEVWRVMA